MGAEGENCGRNHSSALRVKFGTEMLLTDGIMDSEVQEASWKSSLEK